MSEKMQILTMIQNGKITAEEGAKLLEVLENNIENENRFTSQKKPKWLKIKVLEAGEKAKVNVTIPLSLLNIGVKLASKFSPEINEIGLTDNDMEEIFDIIKSGEVGKIVDIDTEKGEKVEIVIE